MPIEKTIIKNPKSLQDFLLKQLYTTVKLYSKGEKETEELLVKSVKKICSDIKTGNCKEPLSAFAKTTVINLAIKKMLKDKSLFKNIKQLETPNDEELCKIFKNIDKVELINYVYVLQQEERVVVSLYILEGFSHVEIGEKLKISTNLSEQILNNAKYNLKNLILNNVNRTL